MESLTLLFQKSSKSIPDSLLSNTVSSPNLSILRCGLFCFSSLSCPRAIDPRESLSSAVRLHRRCKFLGGLPKQPLSHAPHPTPAPRSTSVPAPPNPVANPSRARKFPHNAGPNHRPLEQTFPPPPSPWRADPPERWLTFHPPNPRLSPHRPKWRKYRPSARDAAWTRRRRVSPPGDAKHRRMLHRPGRDSTTRPNPANPLRHFSKMRPRPH